VYEFDDSVIESIEAEIEASALTAAAENPDLTDDDAYHAVAESLCTMYYDAHPEEVNEIWRHAFGVSFDRRYEEVF
jgi:hypothetical protein